MGMGTLVRYSQCTCERRKSSNVLMIHLLVMKVFTYISMTALAVDVLAFTYNVEQTSCLHIDLRF
jgi:hypothetical protein